MTTVVLFTRDLRVHDHPALSAAAEQGRVAPLFVLDDAALRSFGSPNRVRFLLQSLQDLRKNLHALGGELWVRRGDTSREVSAFAREVGARTVHITRDWSAYSRRREAHLSRLPGIELITFPGIGVIDAGELLPTGGDHYRVFTPYWRVWKDEVKRPLLGLPRLEQASGPLPGRLPDARELVSGAASPSAPRGGEGTGRKRASAWLTERLSRYEEERDDLGADGSSHLSSYLHFGCLSPRELVAEAEDAGATEFVRQLCWRDFFMQVLAARPDYPRVDYRAAREPTVEDAEALERWKAGTTGVPIVDAGMRQLMREAWMPNRARLVAASFLTRTMKIDWREGARHFWDWLVDGDLASNAGNWQWVAGTGNAPRRGNAMNPIRQAKRFDRKGAYVRRYVPELSDLDARVLHEPWRLGGDELKRRGYPCADDLFPLVQGN